MPLTVIVGGQFGSEGKGKVAQYFACVRNASAAVRVGGPNSGHTAYDSDRKRFVFRHLPTPALLRDVVCVLGAGTFIDVPILLREINNCQLAPERLRIDPNATIISEADKHVERNAGLRADIGSTLSGTGASLIRRIRRDGSTVLAKDVPELRRYVAPVTPFLRDLLVAGERVVLEGTQGFGLSLFQATDYPFATCRDTTAASFVAEAGLSPLDVDEVVLTLRAFPIRVSGNSGPIPNEIDWETVTREAMSPVPIEELTSVTQTRRRVARFDLRVVEAAITVNRPTQIVMNHLDYFDAGTKCHDFASEKSDRFLRNVETGIKRRVDFLGFNPYTLVPSDR